MSACRPRSSFRPVARPGLHSHPIAAIVLVVSLATCGRSAGNGASPTTPAPSGTTTLTVPSGTTSTVPSATPPVSSSTAPSADQGPSVTTDQTVNRIWFLRAGAGRLVPAYRAGTTAVAALDALLAGPAQGDADQPVSAIPAGTRVRSVAASGTRLTVDLTGTFASGGGSASMLGRLAQLVYTLTEFPGVDTVALALDGEPATTLGGEGIVVSPHMDRGAFDGFKPLVLVDRPLPGEEVTSPFVVSGENTTFENNVEIALTDASDNLLLATYTTGSGPIMDDVGNPVWGPYVASLAFSVTTPTDAVLRVEGGGGSSTEGASTATTVPVHLSPSPSPGLPDASTDPVSTPDSAGGPGGTAYLVDVRTGQHPGYERVVFEFSTPFVPGYSVGYVDPPIIADPSGFTVSVSGAAFLGVRMAWASGVDLSGETYRLTYTGPERLSVRYPAIEEVVRTGDFEAVLGWVIGVRSRTPFRVSTLTDPSRIVIDVASAGQLPTGS